GRPGFWFPNGLCSSPVLSPPAFWAATSWRLLPVVPPRLQKSETRSTSKWVGPAGSGAGGSVWPGDRGSDSRAVWRRASARPFSPIAVYHSAAADKADARDSGVRVGSDENSRNSSSAVVENPPHR